MKILIDMNLSPDWTAAFAAESIESIHWSTVGDPRAKDTEIMEYARSNEYIVFTHDLDFWNDPGTNSSRRPKRHSGPGTGHLAL